MFDGLKKKLVNTAKAETKKEIIRSANEGTIHLGAVLVEVAIFGGIILFASRGNVKAAANATTYVFKNCNIIFK